MSTPSKRRKVAAACTIAALAATVLAVIETATATAAPTPAPTPTPADVIAAHTVTLITGDRVTVTTLAGGEQTAEVKRPDGATGGVRVQQIRGDLMVLPEEALPLLAAGKLDRRLFNVTDLIEMGYDDAGTAELPLIATYEPVKVRSAKPAAPKGSRLVRDLDSVGGAALKAEKAQARGFWDGIGPEIKKVWLDGQVRVNLKESVPLIGAPEAWAAGYTGKGVKVAVLDTGIDATHPDLAGQIDDRVSFVPGEDTGDINGHGTHVASTIVGTGAASNGVYKGVAPEADLIVGKVLGGTAGTGADSWVLAGMQWAAESGADVVNMSLGDSFASDGNDPLSTAVDTLTARYGTLFVIAAGNSGGEDISAPGAAASALTVGATDKKDALAYFSSTGPLVGTGAMKPDLTAPGVSIMAARSQQMSSGTGLYRSISGTSMATPHVAGAAAILAQQHPGWMAKELKDALMSSAKPLSAGYSPFQVGTGRLDVAAAVRNSLRATGSLSFGFFDWPHEPSDAPVTKPLTFTNSGASPVTLNLSISGGGPFSLGAGSVTVPANGSASVDVTGDPRAVSSGRPAGYLTATDSETGTALTRTALGLVKEDERYNLKIKLIGRDGKPATGNVVLYKAGDQWAYIVGVAGETTLRMPPGIYTTDVMLDVPGERADRLGMAVLVDPETVLDRNSEVVLDARTARLLETAAPQRSEVRQRKIDFGVTFTDGSAYRDGILLPIRYDDMYLTPTEPMTRGTFLAGTRWRMGEAIVSFDVLGLLPFPVVTQPGSTLTAGVQKLTMVYAGNGAAGEYANVNAAGKAVVVTRSDAVPPAERAAAAAAAGATLLVVVNDRTGILNESVGASPIPVVTVHRDAGALLVKLARTAVIPVRVKQAPYTSFVYDLTRNYPGAVPDRPLVYRPSRADLARIDARYYGVSLETGGGYRYDMTFTPSTGFYERELFPATRDEWVTPDQVWHEGHQKASGWTDVGYRNSYALGTTTRLNWFAPMARPAFTRAFAVKNGRYQNYMTINVQTWSSSGNDGVEHGGNLPYAAHPINMKLYQGDTLLRERKVSADIQFLTVPAARLPYHLVLDASRPGEQYRLSTRTHTEWDFFSEYNDAENFLPMPLLQLDYELATDLAGDVKAGSVQKLSLNAIPSSGGSGIGEVNLVTAELSYDDGVTWREVKLTKGRDGRWSANIRLGGAAGGFVSVRASAATDAGWRIKQEVIRAYGLS